MTCPLCHNNDGIMLDGPERRTFFGCSQCRLISAPPADHPNLTEARHRYSQHRNGPEFPGYVEFLNQIIDPVLPYLHPSMRALDYGCGPNPTLSNLLHRHGIRCDDYDPLFVPNRPTGPYDVIFSTECFEHFTAPREDITQLLSLLRPGGYLAIMTLLWTSYEQIPAWFYARDPTHLCFYHAETIEWISRTFDLQLVWSDQSRCILWQKITSTLTQR